MSKRRNSPDTTTATILTQENFTYAQQFLNFYNEILVNKKWERGFDYEDTLYIANTLKNIITYLQMESERVDISAIPPHFGRYPLQTRETLREKAQEALIASGKFPRLGYTDISQSKYAEYLQSVQNATLLCLQIFNVIFNLSSHRMCQFYVTQSQNLNVSQNNSQGSSKIMDLFLVSYLNKNFSENYILTHERRYAQTLRSIKQKLKNIQLIFKSLCRRYNGITRPDRQENLFYNRMLLSFPVPFREAFHEYVETKIGKTEQITRKNLKNLLERVLGVHPFFEIDPENPNFDHIDQIAHINHAFQMQCRKFAKFIDFTDIALDYSHFIVTRVGNRLDPMFFQLPASFPDDV